MFSDPVPMAPAATYLNTPIGCRYPGFLAFLYTETETAAEIGAILGSLSFGAVRP
jgi:hypothetical protein